VTEFLFMAHSGLRYIVLVVGLGAAIAAAAGLTASAESKMARSSFTIFRAFVVLVDLQVLLGIGVILTRPFLGIYMGHIVMMLLALAVVHGLAVWGKRRPSKRPEPGHIIVGVAITLGLIAGGILSIGRPVI
jgi:heme A synthase